MQHVFPGIGIDIVVDRNDVLGFLESLAHLLADSHLAGHVRPVDFGDDGRHYRRPGRYFDNLGDAAIFLADGLDAVTQSDGDFVTLARTLVLAGQIDLNIALFRRRPQVILAHQTVEIDRARGAGIGLVIDNIGFLRQFGADFMQHAGGFLDRRADRHIEDDLEFALVVEGQHFQHDELEVGQRHRAENQQNHSDGQLDARRATLDRVEEGRQQLAEGGVEFGIEFRRRGRGVALGMRLHQHQRQPGRDDEGDHQRDAHAHRRIDRDRAHVRPHQAADEGHRQQRGDHGQGGEDGRPADFIDGRRDDLAQRLVGVEALPAVDVLDHHDGIVDQDADGEDQRKQRDAVECEAPGPGREQCGGQGQRDGDTDDHGLAPAGREEDQRDDEGGGEDQFADQLLRLFGGGFAVIAGDGDFDAFRDHRVFERIYPVDRSRRDIGGIDAGLLGQLDGDGRKLAVAVAEPGVTLGLVGAVFDAGDVAHEYRFARFFVTSHGNDQLLHIGGGFEIGAGLHQHFAIAGSQAARGLLGVGHLERGGDFLRRDAESVHPLGIHQHANGVVGAAQRRYVARALDALQFNLDGARHLLQLVGRAFRVFRPEREAEDGHVVDAARLDDRLLHAEIGRQPVAVRHHGVVEAQHGIVVFDTDLELHGDDGHAGARHRIDVLDAMHARQHLFGRAGDEILDILGRGPGEGDHHVGHRHVDLWLFLTRGDEHGENAEQEGDQRQQRGHPRFLKGGGNAPGNAERRGAGGLLAGHRLFARSRVLEGDGGLDRVGDHLVAGRQPG